MAVLRYKSNIPNAKPKWLLELQKSIYWAYLYFNTDGNAWDFRVLKAFIDIRLEALRKDRMIQRCTVETEVRTDEGKTVLFIKRNGHLVQTYYFHGE